MLARSLILSVAAALITAGCYSPSGGLVKRIGAANTYYSTESMPATVTIVDTRTEEPFFTIEIPVGKQLTMNFKEGKGDDPALTPDLMVYQIFPLGTTIVLLSRVRMAVETRFIWLTSPKTPPPHSIRSPTSKGR